MKLLTHTLDGGIHRFRELSRRRRGYVRASDIIKGGTSDLWCRRPKTEEAETADSADILTHFQARLSSQFSRFLLLH